MFRIARYFGWTEILYGDSGQYRFTAEDETRDVADSIGWVAATFTYDKLDRRLKDNRLTPHLMLW